MIATAMPSICAQTGVVCRDAVAAVQCQLRNRLARGTAAPRNLRPLEVPAKMMSQSPYRRNQGARFRSRHRDWAVASMDPGLSPSERAKAEAKVAADTIDRIVRSVVKEMMVSEGVALLSGDEKSEMSMQQAIDNALEDEADLLNDTFVMMTMKMAEAARERGQTDMVDILVRIYESTVKYVTANMPPELQLLSSLMEESSGERRDGMLRAALQGSPQGTEGTAAWCDLEALAATSTRMVEDMEKRQIVVDRNLLVRMCLVREEIRKVAMELAGLNAPEIVKFETVIPGRVSHFIKELMPVAESDRRMALLEKVFRGDWEGAAPNARFVRRQDDSNSGSQEDVVPDVVRPGALLSALLRLQIAMENDKDKLSINKKKIQRVAEIRHEAVHVMKRVAFK